MDWNAALNIERAQAKVVSDAFGDWYKDPWGWPEIAWVVRNQTSLVEARLNSRGTMRCVKLDVPKENYVTRPTLILDGLDPAGEKAPTRVRDYLANKLEQRALPSFMLPLVAQRLSRWIPDDARQLIREVAKRTENPFELRALAYAGLACGVGRSEVRRWLGEFPESDVVLKFLDDNRFKPPKSLS